MKMAMAMSSGIGPEEIRRVQEQRTAREQEQRATARKKFIEHLAGITCQTIRLMILLLMSVTLIYVLSANSEINSYLSQLERKISSRPSTPSVIRQGALNHEAEVDAASH